MSLTEDKPGKRVLFLGNEAVARGAIEAGIQLGASYPGTPSSEIMENLIVASKKLGFYAEWSTNETVAFQVAAGASIVGGRSLFSCKNAGLNVVMDMLMTLPYTGIRGGFVIVSADDPGAWYSSNEQDTRVVGFYAEIPVFEPSDQQSAKDMTKAAFELSEKIELPVMVRSCTRLGHASGDVTLGAIVTRRNKIVFDKHWKIPYRWNVYGPPGVVDKHKWQKGKLPEIKHYSDETSFNSYWRGNGAKLGIVTSGVASAYVIESLKRLGKEHEINLLLVGMPYPLSEKLALELLSHSEEVLVVEEGDPLIERQLSQVVVQYGRLVKIVGKLSGKLVPETNELNPDIVEEVVSRFIHAEQKKQEDRRGLKESLVALVAERSASWCAGCPHLGSFWALKKALPNKVNILNTGIGCYEMSGYGIAASTIEAAETTDSRQWRALTPYEMTDTLYIMGSETALAQGEYHVGYKDGKIVSILGDSSFYHTNLSPIVNAVYNKSEQLILVLDNYWTCMTGHQPNPATGMTAYGEESDVPEIEGICRTFGVKYVKNVDPYDLGSTIKAIREALEHKGGPAVIVTKRVCALQRLRDMRRERLKIPTYQVNENCTGCKQCLYLGCPAIGFNPDRGVAFIDSLQCVGCGLCDQEEVCPFHAHEKQGESNF
jgi:indolepyruvate ferredoxin oxidoreductase alpha subunit